MTWFQGDSFGSAEVKHRYLKRRKKLKALRTARKMGSRHRRWNRRKIASTSTTIRIHRADRWAGEYLYVVLLSRDLDLDGQAELLDRMRDACPGDIKALYETQKSYWRRRSIKGQRWLEKVLLRSEMALFVLQLTFPTAIWRIKRIADPLNAEAGVENPSSGSGD